MKPFYGATYIPPKSQYGRPGFVDVVNRLSEAWKSDRKTIRESTEHISEYLDNYAKTDPSASVDDSVLHSGYSHFAQSYDSLNGGFGGGPKFPRPAALNFLLHYHARTGNDSALQMTLSSLRKMAEGGVYDHLAGGFHRYSVDGQWRVPHFEKMLYDQAQLANSYLDAFQITHDYYYAVIARGVLDYVVATMRDHKGGFYSAEDAESALDPANPDEKEE